MVRERKERVQRQRRPKREERGEDAAGRRGDILEFQLDR
jgi:hypothetical protein